MKTLESLTKDEKGLLLYLETRAVDYSGAVEIDKMNKDDFGIATKWNEEGFLGFGRIASDFLGSLRGATHWVRLSEEAFQLAHEERRARAKRTWEKRHWMTTEEKRNAPIE